MKQINFKKTKKLLDKYKIHYSKTLLAKSKKDALKKAKKIGYPVVIKISSERIIHKSDEGMVETNLKNEKELESAYDKIMKKAKKKVKEKDIEGILVQEVAEGKEVIIGVKRDPQFDVVLMFGLGGIFVEIIKDVSFRVAPINRKEAEKMIKETKGSKILEGVRGENSVKISSLVTMIKRVGKMAIENKNIEEIDFNPVIANEKSANVVDFRILEKENE